MTESFTKDSAIRLFGMKIPLLVEDDSPGIVCQHSPSSEREGKEEAEKAEKDFPKGQIDENIQQDDASPPDTEESSCGQETLADTDVNPNTPSVSEESAKSKASKSEKEQSDAANSQEKTLKKPDKILPCPRCHSMDTKFCYYNNYNVNQPRHFCKACQRYWTAGGTMRNVPVGAGRRKNKNSASHCRHMTISEALKAARIEAANGAQYPTLKPDGRVLSFGLDAPISDSMASVLNLVDKKVLNGTRNGYNSLEDPRIPVLCTGSKNVDNCSSGSSVTVANSREEVGRSGQKEPIPQNINGFASPVPCLPGVPWPYPWNSALPPPSFCPPGFPMPFCPAPYWNCGITGAWNIPLLSPQSSSSSNQTNTFKGPNSPTLGKHSRDASTLKHDDLERDETSRHKNGCIVVPKILRIDDPSEAAKSSIWTTLGIKNESLSNGGLFKAFKPKSTEKNGIAEPSPELRANPAALSRSINFHESS